MSLYSQRPRLCKTRADSGELMSCGSNASERWRRAAIYVDKVIKGAKPANLPVEQADKIRARGEDEDGQSDRPHDSADYPRARGSGDRVGNRVNQRSRALPRAAGESSE